MRRNDCEKRAAVSSVVRDSGERDHDCSASGGEWVGNVSDSITAAAPAAQQDTLLETAFSCIDVNGLPGWTLVVISSDYLGKSDDELGRILLLDFLQTMQGRVALPDEIVFYHRGVCLLEEEHPACVPLRGLADKGVHLSVSSESCLHFNVKPALKHAEQIPMSEICKHMMKADKVVHP